MDLHEILQKQYLESIPKGVLWIVHQKLNEAREEGLSQIAITPSDTTVSGTGQTYLGPVALSLKKLGYNVIESPLEAQIGLKKPTIPDPERMREVIGQLKDAADKGMRAAVVPLHLDIAAWLRAQGLDVTVADASMLGWLSALGVDVDIAEVSLLVRWD